MNGDGFLRLFQTTLYEIGYLDSLITIGDIQITTSRLDDSIYWNLATIEGGVLRDLPEIEKAFHSENRSTTFYLAENEQNVDLEKALTENDYSQVEYEVWLEIKNPTIDENRFDQVEQVVSADDLEVFIKTIDGGYGSDDPENPYGSLGVYLEQIRQSAEKYGLGKKIKHYIVRDENGEPTGVGSLTNFDGIGYISNLATLPKFRGQGYSKVLVNYLLDLSVKNDNKTHCLATEYGSKPDKIYRHLGFEEMFRAKYFAEGAKMSSNPYKLTSSELKYKNPWISVREDKVVRENGHEGLFGVVEMLSGVSVLPIDEDGNVYLAKEYKYAIGTDSIETISGGMDDGEEPIDAARRELKEEIGATAGEMIPLGFIDPFTTVIKSRNYIFLAKNLSFGDSSPDEMENIKIVKMPFGRAYNLVMDSQISHGASVVAILRAKDLLERAGYE
jgi:8-oxo-dGTP pyrophosphatase MutT (NUDIX family)/ribosomal protein S18 acetylase RimI-like enzyme